MNQKLSKIEERVWEIEGWLTIKECELLFDQAKKCEGKGAIVEIGSYRARSTICLGIGSKENSKTKVYAIDSYQDNQYAGAADFEKFKENIRKNGLLDTVVALTKTSQEAAIEFKEPVEFIFIDGNHEYEAVKLDFNLWFPKLIEGGIIAFHDAISPGPSRAVEEFIYKSKYFKNIKEIDSILTAQKVRVNTFGDRLINKFGLLLRKTNYLGWAAIIPKPIRIMLRQIKLFLKIFYNNILVR